MDPTSDKKAKSAERASGDLEVLTRTVEGVLRKLLRLLVGRISLPKFQELIRVIFIQEAESVLRSDEHDKSVSLSALAVMTGLDTRMLSKALKEFNSTEPVYKQADILAEITPECTVLDAWHSRIEFLDSSTGSPKVLSVKGERDSFEHLVRESLPKRGVTAKSLLNRLIESGNVKRAEKPEHVELVQEQYSPFRSNDETAILEIGLAAVGSLLATLNHNVQSVVDEQGATHYQRGCWTHRCAKEKQAELRQALANCLAKADVEARSIISEYEDSTELEGQVTSGVSMFYFEDNSARLLSADRAGDNRDKDATDG